LNPEHVIRVLVFMLRSLLTSLKVLLP